jgi:hypothetical protein
LDKEKDAQYLIYRKRNIKFPIPWFCEEQTMRKTFVLLGFVFSVLASSCTIFSLQIRPTGFIALGESFRNSGLVTISAQTAWVNESLGNGHSEAPGMKKKISGFYVTITNNTNNAVRVIWSKSAVKYNGGSHSPFIEGQKFENSSMFMSPSIIPPRGSLRKYIYSSQQRYVEPDKHEGWKMRPIESDDVALIFCVQSKDIEDYYTVNIR